MVLITCTICNRRFYKTEHFKRHERSHTKERPYECSICQKRFSRSDVLSRHAKSHNKKIEQPSKRARSNESSFEQVHNVLTSTIGGASMGVSTPGDTQGLLPNTRTDGHATQTTDISPYHARSETDLNPMMADDQQAYFAWNKAACQPPEMASDEMLQQWLEPQEDTYSSLDLVGSPGLRHTGNLSVSSDQQHRQSSESTASGKTAIGRFAEVQRCWLGLPNIPGRLMSSLWRHVADNDLGNLFAVRISHLSHGQVDLQESHYGLDEECKQRLHAAFGLAQAVDPRLQSPENGSLPLAMSNSVLSSFSNFPPPGVLDTALDMYFCNFHPLIPFVHLPTFSANNTRLLLLYVMCLIGMAMMETKGAADFISKNFQFVLALVKTDLAKCSVGIENSLNSLSTFATAFLFLNLTAMTGEMEHFEMCQLLYVDLISVVQRHGLLAATEGQLLDIGLFEMFRDPNTQWKAWSKVESTKRLIAGLLQLDSCYSSFLSTSPIIVPDSIQLILPCDEDLFRANSSMEWMQLLRSGKPILMPTVMAPSENVNVPTLNTPMGDFCVQGVLSMIHVRLSEAYHRLLSGHICNQFAPCQTYAMDGRARSLPSLQVQIVNNYGDSMQKLNPNTIILWHSICMRLTADIQTFDLAAGRAGPEPVRQALDDISAWSQTPAARRACLHAASIYKAMASRKTSNLPTFHSVTSLFSAALVLGLYMFMVPDSSESQTGLEGIELLDDVDWQAVGAEGFTSFMEPQASHSLTPVTNAATNFIRNGGTVYFRGFAVAGGYLSAQQIFLDYAGLLKDAGPWTVRKFSHALHILSDALVDME